MSLHKPEEGSYCSSAPFSVWLFLRKSHSRGHLIVGIEIRQLDADGGLSRRADALDVDAHDLAELADSHSLDCIVHHSKSGNFPDQERRFYVDRTPSHHVIAGSRSPNKRKGVSRSSHPLEANFLRE